MGSLWTNVLADARMCIVTGELNFSIVSLIALEEVRKVIVGVRKVGMLPWGVC